MLEELKTNQQISKDDDKETAAQEDTNKAIDAVMDQAEQQGIVEPAPDLVSQIIKAPDTRSLQQCLDIFNLNQSKKNALRVLKLNALLDAVEDQAIERFQKRPDQVSNKDLLEYMQVVSNQIEKSQNAAEQLGTKPAIQINQQKNEVNVHIGGPNLDRDSKDRVIEAVQALLQQAKNQASQPQGSNLPSEACIVSAVSEEGEESSAPNPINQPESEVL